VLELYREFKSQFYIIINTLGDHVDKKPFATFILVASLFASLISVSEAEASQPSAINCNLESYSGVLVKSSSIVVNVKATKEVVFSGWVAQTSSHNPDPTTVELDFFSSDGKKLLIKNKGSRFQSRKDVAKAFNNLAINNVGFQVPLVSSLPSGEYLAKIIATFGSAKTQFSCGSWAVKLK